MIQVVLIVLFGILILYAAAKLYHESGRQPEPAPTIEDFSQARSAIDATFREAASIQQLFSEEDLQFVLRTLDPEAALLFRKERKRLAIEWLQRTQKLVAQLLDLHRRLATCIDHPSQGLETILILQHIVFIAISHVVLVSLWMWGPFAFAAITRYIVRKSENFCSIFSLRLDRVNPARLSAPR